MKLSFGKIIRVAIKVAPTIMAAVPVVKVAVREVKAALRDDDATRAGRG